MVRSKLLLALAGALAITVTNTATAAENELPVAVLTIQTLDAFDQADALTSALKRAVEDADGWTYAQLDKDHALLFLISSLGCTEPPDATCQQKIGDELKVDRYVWGTMKKEGEEVTGTLHLWARGTGTKSASYRFPVNVVAPGDQDFVNLTLAKFEEIVGPPSPAKLKVKAGALDGTVFVDGKEVAKLVGGTATFELPKGSHKVTVVADGYNDMETTVDLKAREEREISLMPVAKGSGPDIQKILGFTSLGVGVAAAGVATYAGVRVLQINDELGIYRTGDDPNGAFFVEGSGDEDLDGCDPGPGGDYPYLDTEADGTQRQPIMDKCEEGKTMQTLTLAFWPIAGAFAGTGIILLATADWSGGGDTKEAAELPFLILPSFGPDGGGATFSTRF